MPLLGQQAASSAAAQSPPTSASATSSLFAGEAPLIQGASANTSFLPGDFNGDGLTDLAVATTTSIDWYPSLGGTSGMGPSQLVLATLFPVLMESGDLDGDGELDLITICGSDVCWMRNLGAGAQWASGEPITPLQPGTKRVQAVDLDSDGDLDLLFADGFGGTASWSRNTGGTPLFDPPQVIASIPGFMSFAHGADFDGDGDMDVLTRGGAQGALAWFANLDGAGSFGTAIIIDAGFAPGDAIAADLDGDGDQDVVTSGISTSVRLYRNLDGLGSFSPSQAVAGTGSVDAVRTADLDADGAIDLFTQTNSPQGTELAWFRNEGGPAPFGSSTPIATAGSSVSAQHLVDVDGDSDLDVVWAVSDIQWAQNLLIAPPWPSLGGALAGSGPAPVLQGDGDLSSGSVVTMSLSGALPGSTTALVMGLSELSAPFKGGLLVPNPDLVIAGLPVDGNGEHVLVDQWPAGVAAGVCVWFQHWTSDPGGPVGFAASNAILGITP